MSATLTPLFSPTQIPGCFLWMDAADSTTVSLSGSNVTAWRDKSPSPIPLTLTGTPTYSSNAVRFTGSQNFVNSAISFNMATMTMFLVGYSAAGIVGSGGFVSLVPIANGVDWNQNNAITYNFDPTTLGQLYTTYNFNATGTNNVYLSSTNPILFCHVQNNTSYTLYGSGSNFATRTFSAPGVTTGISIGARYQSGNGTASHYYYGPMNEILLYSQALSDAQRQQIEGYLAWKWNVVSGLPANHPYKTTPVFSAGYPPFTIQRTSVPVPVFAPTQISGCLIWLDATDTQSILLSGDRVIQWNDKSGLGFDFSNTTLAVCPQFLSKGFNTNYPSLQFNDSFLRRTNTGTTASTYTGFFVVQGNDIPSTAQSLMDFQSGRFIFAHADFNGSFRPAIFNAGWITMPNISNPVPLIYSFVCGANGGLYTNGILNATVPSFTPIAINGAVGLGARFSFDSARLNARLSEVIVYSNNLGTNERQQIEGYLAWKWGLVSSLPNGHPYKTPPIAPFSYGVRQTVLSKFNPLSITGCSLWLDAADQSSLILSGTNVTQWTDKSGTTNVTQSTSSLQPTYLASGFNGRPTLRITGVQGSSYQELTTGTTSQYDSVTAMYVFLVYRVITPVPSNPGIFSIQNKVSYYLRGLDNNNNFTGSNVWTYNGASFVANNDTIVTYDQNAFLCLGLDNGFQSTFLNGSFTGAPKAFSFGSGTSLVLRIGYSGYNTNDGFNGCISEVLVYKASLSTAQRQQVEGYLAWKWGLVASLPANHPFKLYPPPPS